MKIEDDCVGCAIGCISCGRRESPHYYCDECGDEVEEINDLFDYDGQDLCIECLKKAVPRVTEDKYNGWEE